MRNATVPAARVARFVQPPDSMTVERVARAASREAAPWVERLARVGYAAIGIVYGVAGALTAAAGLGAGGRTADKRDAIVFVRHLPAGKAILLVMAAGLLGYSIWKIISALVDSDSRGRSAKGIAIRIGSAFTGVIYIAIASGVFRLATKGQSGSGSDVTVREWVHKALQAPFGRTLVGLAGLVLIGTAIYQFYRAWESKLTRRLHLDTLQPDTRRRVVNICRFGIAARAIVFGVIGASLLTAAIHFASSEAQGTAGAMTTVSHAPFGGALLVIIGLGFVAFGVYALTEARYRTVRAA